MYKIPANTLFIGQNQVFVPQCHSTNSLATELIRNTDLAEGTIVITDHQTAGRGQRGNSWESDPSMNLTFSIVLKPSFLLASDQFFLTMVVSLALREFLTSRIATEVKIKWPNDILIGDRKICGILIENLLRVDTIQHSIVGIGLNVNQNSFTMAGPTSMSLIAGYHFDHTWELNLLLEKLEKYYLKLRSGEKDLLKQEYLDHLYWKGETHEFKLKDEEFTGVISDVDDNGRLLIMSNGEKISVGLKEIKFVS